MPLTFTQGLLIGQLSVVLLIGAFIKFFIFGEAPSRSSSTTRTSKHIRTTSFHGLSPRNTPANSLRKKASSNNVLRAVPTSATDTTSILKKTYYHIPSNKGHGRINHNTHQPESLDWFNVLIAQTIAEYRQTAYTLRDSSADRPSVLASLSAAINNPGKRPSWIDEITITEISIGEEFPIFSNVRVTALEDDSGSALDGRLQALVDVDLSDDNLTLGIETSLILNYPKPASAILPVALTVSLVRFSGTLSISFVPATEDSPSQQQGESSSKPKTNLAFSFLPDYRLDLSVKSLIGSRSRLQDVPKVAQLVESRIQAWFEERVVEPRVQVVPLPGLWPRMGKTRVREGQEDDRPLSKDGDRLHQPQVLSDRRKESFPSQDEAEALIRGLRMRAPHQRRNSEAVMDDQEFKLPGALPA